ncbi:MAG: glutamate-1-semialdehyde 2,1-aminomutase [Myxococcales bacterium]|nr:glutamate-1-semialdehyde 2,1-aminomutase [Myxococcales bacterium]
MNREKSQAFHHQAQRTLVGGVNSPVRAFKSVGGDPVYFESALGAFLRDVDGNEYLDYVGSWGPMILGHGHPDVVEAIVEQARRGTSFGAPSPLEVKLAEKVASIVPSVEKVRFVNSGTEATMSAIRLARGATGRDKIVKFEGCYHGHGDSFLIAAGSGSLTFGEPDSPGVTPGTAHDTLLAPYNSLDAVRRLVEQNPGEIAAVILEPVAGNMGVIPPADGFLTGLRTLCDEAGMLLIFDEVMTGFRVAAGGAQALYGVAPDITTMGKVIGGGLPVGAYGASAELMDHVSPAGPIYQAGTLSGNPLAMAAGLATLERLTPEVYDELEQRGSQLEAGLIDAAKSAGVPACVNRVGSMLTLFFGEAPVRSLTDAKRCDAARFGRFFHHMLDAGIALPPSAFEAWFLSAAHDAAQIERTLEHASVFFRNREG